MKKKPSTVQNVAEMQRRARILLHELMTEEKESIIIPIIAITEVLKGILPAEHGEFIAKLQKSFFLPLFDLKAASLAAVLWQKRHGLPKEEQGTRLVVKNDVMVVATAQAAGAAEFYSHDPACRRLASLAGMRGLDLPTHSESLLTELALKEEDKEEE